MRVGDGGGREGGGCCGGGGGGGGDFAVGVVAQSGAGVFQRHDVGGVRRREGVPRRHGFLHDLLPFLASQDGFFVLDLRVGATHDFSDKTTLNTIKKNNLKVKIHY